MNKYIITFGPDHLSSVSIPIRPLKMMLIVEAESEEEARSKVFKSFIGPYFSTSYPYSKKEEFIERFKMVEIKFDDLIELEKEQNDMDS
jgi:hypothetical protein